MLKTKRPLFFLFGMVTSLLIVSCANLAFAASGQVSYNFSNVSLNGEKKITAGEDITAANGQKVPGTILFTDAAGGKTNYLPIRAISELLGVEIGYDSATKTVLLGEQHSSQLISGRQWQRELNRQGGIHYVGPKDAGASMNTPAPTWRINWLPEGWKLDTAITRYPALAAAEWYYQKGEDTLTLYCYALSNGYFGEWIGPGIDTDALRQETKIQGKSADFYQTEEDAILAWEDSDGTLFLLVLHGKLDKSILEKIANSMTESSSETMPEYNLNWVPDRTRKSFRETMPGTVIVTPSSSIYFTYSDQPLTTPDGLPETVEVNGIKAQFWAGDPNAKGEVKIIDGEEVELPAEARISTLLWKDTNTGLSFRIRGALDKATILRMAENVSLK